MQIESSSNHSLAKLMFKLIVGSKCMGQMKRTVSSFSFIAFIRYANTDRTHVSGVETRLSCVFASCVRIEKYNSRCGFHWRSQLKAIKLSFSNINLTDAQSQSCSGVCVCAMNFIRFCFRYVYICL